MARRFLAPINHWVGAADPTTPTPTVGDEYFNSALGVSKIYNGTNWLFKNEFAIPFTIGGTLSVGVTGRKQRIRNRSGSTWLVLGANLYIATAPVGSSATLQVNVNGSSSFSISCATTVNEANTTPGVTINDGDYVDVDVTAVGSTTAGADATLTLNFGS